MHLSIDEKWEACIRKHRIDTKLENAIHSVIEREVLPDEPMLAIAEALIPDKRDRPSFLHERLLYVEREHETLRFHANRTAQSYLHVRQSLEKSQEEYAMMQQMYECAAEDYMQELKKNEERHDNMLRLNQLSAEYKEMKKTLADDKEKLHAAIAERSEHLDSMFAKIPECAICMEQGPFSWMYKGCKHISVCDACHASGRVTQCPLHDKKMVFAKVEKIYFAYH